MRIAIASSSRLALPSIKRIEEAGHTIVGVITRPDAPRGRGRELMPSELALAMPDRVITKPSSDIELEAALRDFAPELVVTIAYGRLIKADALSMPPYGWLNLHFSILPRFRGAAPVQRALLEGVQETGCTVFKLDTGMDTGPIYRTHRVSLRGDETTGALLKRLSEIGADEVVASIQMISEGIEPLPQEGASSLAPKIGKDERRILWSEDAEMIDRRVRALQPTPGAWAIFRGERITITKTRSIVGEGEPGSIIRNDPLTVATGKGALVIENLQSPGRRELDAAEWVRGARLTPADRFE